MVRAVPNQYTESVLAIGVAPPFWLGDGSDAATLRALSFNHMGDIVFYPLAVLRDETVDLAYGFGWAGRFYAGPQGVPFHRRCAQVLDCAGLFSGAGRVLAVWCD